MDLGDFKAMLDRAGIQYQIKDAEDGICSVSEGHLASQILTIFTAKEEETKTTKNHGYPTFETQFAFDDKGNLVCVGLWE